MIGTGMLMLLADASTGMPGDGIPANVLALIAAVGVLALVFVFAAIFVSLRPTRKDDDNEPRQ